MPSINDVRYFPYVPRPYQKQAWVSVREAAESGDNLFLQAPTGWGKTAVVLSALIGDFDVLWIARTGNQVDRPIDELKRINEVFNESFFGLSFRGKREMCLKAGEKDFDYDAIKYLCRRCEFNRDFELTIRQPLTFTELKEIAEAEKICPYKLQLKLAPKAELVAFSYNYLLMDLPVLDVVGTDRVLVVDEAHNIIDAARNIFSARLSAFSIKRAMKECSKFGFPEVSGKMQALLELPEKEQEFEPGDYAWVEELIEPCLEVARKVYELQARQGRLPRSYARRFAKFWSRALKKEEGVAYFVSEQGYEIFDMRSREILSHIWEVFPSVIFMSGTLKPVSAFADMVGARGRAFYVPSMFRKENVRSFILTGVSTRGEELSELMRQRYAVVLDSYLSIPGNLAIFAASYRIIDELKEEIIKSAIRHGKKLVFEREDMKGSEAREVLLRFRVEQNLVLVAPCAGRFAEGADFPRNSLSAALVLGIPFEKPTLKTQKLLEYASKTYGRKGRYYYYVIPALRKASQALGRVLRSPEDRGIFVLADERFRYRSYFELLPDFVQATARFLSYIRFPKVVQVLNLT